MPSLDQQAQRAKKTIKNGLRGYSNYTHWPFHPERDIIVLWRMHRGWSSPVTSKHIGCSISTIGWVSRRFYKDPSEVFLNPVLSGTHCGCEKLCGSARSADSPCPVCRNAKPAPTWPVTSYQRRLFNSMT